MSKTTAGDAYKQKRGDLRHYAEAVEVCLKAKEDDIVHIENYGDISTLTESIEVKDLSSSITLQSYQIWNTLKNWTTDFLEFNQFDKLILLTTSPVKTDKNISKWNLSSKEAKYSYLIAASRKIKSRQKPSEEKINLIKKVTTFNDKYTKNDCLEILDKFHIVTSSVDSASKYRELQNLKIFKLHPKKNVSTIIDIVISFIFQRGLEGNDKWNINISELYRLIRKVGENHKKKLPKNNLSNDVNVKDLKEAVFVKELNQIELEIDLIQEAISDYCQTQNTIIDLIDENKLYKTDIEDYKNGELFRHLKANKRRQELEDGDVIKNSKKNYINSLWKIRLINLNHIENEPFFQRGNIHSIVDEGKHKWLLNEN